MSKIFKIIGRVETTPLKEDYHKLLNSVQYYHKKYGMLDIFAGFITDFMSSDYISFLIPRYTKESSRGALLHDWLFKYQIWNGNKIGMIEANNLAYELWVKDGMAKWKAKLAKYSLNAGGWITWNKYKRVLNEKS